MGASKSGGVGGRRVVGVARTVITLDGRDSAATVIYRDTHAPTGQVTEGGDSCIRDGRWEALGGGIAKLSPVMTEISQGCSESVYATHFPLQQTKLPGPRQTGKLQDLHSPQQPEVLTTPSSPSPATTTRENCR